MTWEFTVSHTMLKSFCQYLRNVGTIENVYPHWEKPVEIVIFYDRSDKLTEQDFRERGALTCDLRQPHIGWD